MPLYSSQTEADYLETQHDHEKCVTEKTKLEHLTFGKKIEIMNM